LVLKKDDLTRSFFVAPNLTQPSIHQLTPLEEGGVIARSGFKFQDHVAVGFCLQMLIEDNLKQVWCESQDDITLIWDGGVLGEEVEFVQVKSNKLEHLWSAKEICKRDKDAQKNLKIGSSILEKSLAYDRCCEACRFRMVTAMQVNRELEVLRLPQSSPDRTYTNQKYLELCTKIGDDVKGFTSSNGNDSIFWLSRMFWQVEHDAEALERKNIELLMRFVEKCRDYLVSDQLKELYSKLLQKVQEAAIAKWNQDPNAKKIVREDLSIWLAKAINEAQHPISTTSGSKLEEKMKQASLPDDAIANAQEARRFYRQERMTAKYLETSDQSKIERAVQATLQQLRAELDAGNFPDSGEKFHAICLSTLDSLQHTMPTKGSLELFYVQGIMYNITDRCLHRFRRPQI
jgi:hypothetical protein